MVSTRVRDYQLTGATLINFRAPTPALYVTVTEKTRILPPNSQKLKSYNNDTWASGVKAEDRLTQ